MAPTDHDEFDDTPVFTDEPAFGPGTENPGEPLVGTEHPADGTTSPEISNAPAPEINDNLDDDSSPTLVGEPGPTLGSVEGGVSSANMTEVAPAILPPGTEEHPKNAVTLKVVPRAGGADNFVARLGDGEDARDYAVTRAGIVVDAETAATLAEMALASGVVLSQEAKG